MAAARHGALVMEGSKEAEQIIGISLNPVKSTLIEIRNNKEDKEI